MLLRRAPIAPSARGAFVIEHVPAETSGMTYHCINCLYPLRSSPAALVLIVSM